MTRLAIALAACVACFAILAPNLVAKSSAPAVGDYGGKAKSAIEQESHDQPPIYFTYQGGKAKKFEINMPFACGTGGIRDGFDYPFGAKAAAVPAPGGKFNASEQGSVEVVSQVGEDVVYGTASVKAVFQGKITGKQASGTYTITSADGSGCSGHGTWKAKLAK
ncbi:MAG TPA: hypothetical protein VGO36_04450 [Solirubrobacterales bacterium]|jgi:hypothetical protein|nr:hypothetical protein [Solirubrobacterales bacterium]